MSRSKNISIDRIKFEAAINEIMKTRHFTSWSDICADMVVNKDLLRSAARKEQISAKTAKMLEKFYGLTIDQYTPAIEGIFEDRDLAQMVAELKRLNAELIELTDQFAALVERSKS